VSDVCESGFRGISAFPKVSLITKRDESNSM
jgi:hypothetical protein